MAEIDVQNEILDPMQRMFTPRRHQMGAGDQQMALREYIQTLKHFDAIDLKEAWRAVLETYTAQVWPAPAYFASAARKARAERPAPKKTGSSAQIQREPISRPIMWWCQDPKLWKRGWREEDIPEEWRAAYYARKERLANGEVKPWDINTGMLAARKYFGRFPQGPERAGS